MTTLQSLLVPSKSVTVDFPGMDGFKLEIAFLSREELVKLRKKCVTTSFNRKTRQPEEKFDEDLFLKLYVAATLRGWTGLKYKYLEQLLVADLSSVNDLESELEFSEDNALVLMKNATEIDSFITDVTSDLTNFTKHSSKISNGS